MPWTPRQREVLHELGHTLWQPRPRSGLPGWAAPVAIEKAEEIQPIGESQLRNVLPVATDEAGEIQPTGELQRGNVLSVATENAQEIPPIDEPPFENALPVAPGPLAPEVVAGDQLPPPADSAASAISRTDRVNVPEDPLAHLGWDDLAARVAACSACSHLAQRRRNTVFGVGDRKARWLFIGEAPGAEEDRRGEPFVGPAGQLLDNMLAAIGLQRGADVYIANVIKCRPPDNRNPSPSESAACRGFLDRQIALLQPHLIVALGLVAAQNLLATDAPLYALRGRLAEYQGIPLLVTYHPAYLLRSRKDKAKAWEDLCRARALMAARTR